MAKRQPRFKVVAKLSRPNKDQLAVYNRLVAEAALTEVRPLVIKADVPVRVVSGGVGMKVDGDAEFAYALEDGGLLIKASFGVDLKAGRQKVFRGHAEFLGSYRWEARKEGRDCIPDAVLDAFVAVHAPAHFWPFARELFHSLTGRFGVPRIVLPLRPPPGVLASR